MDNREEAIRTLSAMVKDRERLMDAIARKRSWRPSEKAATRGLYLRQIKALELAIASLSL